MSNSAQNSVKNESNMKMQLYFGDFFKSFKRFWWTILVFAVLLGGFAAFRQYTSYTPVYKSAATFTVNTQKSTAVGGVSSYSFYYDSATATQLADTFPYILSSNLLQDAICEDLGVGVMPASLSASSVSGSNMFTITARGRDPEATYNTLVSAMENYPFVAKYVVGNIEFEIIKPPVLPTEPSNVRFNKLDIRKWCVIGVMLGLLWIALFAVTRRTVRNKDDVKRELNSQFLGSLPRVAFKKHKMRIDESVLITNEKVQSGFYESVRAFRNVFLNSVGTDDKVIMVTSTAPAEGKTTVAVNLALSLASRGKRVLLTDADFRNPSVAPLLRFDLEELDYSEECDTYKTAYLEKYKLYYMSITARADENSKFIDTKTVREIFEGVRDSYDFIIVDTPPCGLVSDAVFISEAADAAIYVVLQDTVRASKIRTSLDSILSSDIKLLGCVINGTQSMGAHGYGYSYGYGYGYGYGKKGKKD